MKNATAGFWIWLLLTLVMLGAAGAVAWMGMGLRDPARERAFTHSQRALYDLKTQEVEGNPEIFVHLAGKDAGHAPDAEPAHAEETHDEEHPDAHSDVHADPADHHDAQPKEDKHHAADAHAPAKPHSDDHHDDHHAPKAHPPAAGHDDHGASKNHDKTEHANTGHAEAAHEDHAEVKTGAHAAGHPVDKKAPAKTAAPAKPSKPKTPPPPWADYAREFENPKELPTISIVITGLGMSKSTTAQALELPPEVGLAFSPYSHDIRKWGEDAHGKGFEIYTELPMEPLNYPLTDPGPNALLTDLEAKDLHKRLAWIMKRTPLDVGLVSPLEEKFSSYAESMITVMGDIKKARQFLIMGKPRDPKSALEVAMSETGALGFATDIGLDTTISAEHISEALKKLETIAANDGHALAIGRPYPITLKHLKKWAKTLEAKGILLAPPSHIALQFHQHRLANLSPKSPKSHGETAHQEKTPSHNSHAPAQDDHAGHH